MTRKLQTVGDYVLLKYEFKKYERHYVAEITSISDREEDMNDRLISVSYLRKCSDFSGESPRFQFPNIPNTDFVSTNSIVQCLPTRNIARNTYYWPDNSAQFLKTIVVIPSSSDLFLRQRLFLYYSKYNEMKWNEIYFFDYLQNEKLCEHWWDIHVDEVDNEAWVRKFMWMFHICLVNVKVSIKISINNFFMNMTYCTKVEIESQRPEA